MSGKTLSNMSDRMAVRLEASMPLRRSHQEFRGHLSAPPVAAASNPSTWPNRYPMCGTVETVHRPGGVYKDEQLLSSCSQAALVYAEHEILALPVR